MSRGLSYFNECAMSAWKIYKYSSVFGWTLLYVSVRSCWLTVVQILFSFADFSVHISISSWEEDVEVPNYNLYSFPFISIWFCFMYFEALLFDVYTFRSLCVPGGLIFLSLCTIPLVSSNYLSNNITTPAF